MRGGNPIGRRRFCWSNPPALIGGGCSDIGTAGPAVGKLLDQCRRSRRTDSKHLSHKCASRYYSSSTSECRMTMDLQQRAREPCSGCNDSSHRPNSPNARSPTGTSVTIASTTTGVKRSFDVAFLCAPDTKLSKLQHEQERCHNLSRKSAFTKVSKETSPERGMSPYDVFAPKHFQQQQQHKSFSSFSLPQPGFLLNSGREKLINSYLSKPPRSVYGYGVEKELLNIAHPLLYPAEAYISAAYPYAASNFMSATSPPPSLGHQNGMSRELMRPGHMSNNSSSPPVAPQFLSVAVSPVSSLLPPSLAALSLPAQNVCAKCNLSFRMTSDLVYHMRSHHKQEAADPLRRKREEKLKCPVCSESFRERHHLTRHMTAHQDKAGDREDSGEMLINAGGSQIAGK